MTKSEKIIYLNKLISQKDDFVYGGPKYLYKYRPFDEFAFEMLKNQIVFLCPANKLDDETECMTSVDVDSLIDLETNNLKRICLDQIIHMLKPYCSPEVFEEVRRKIWSVCYRNGKTRNHLLLDISHEIQEAVPNVDIVPFINWLVNIPEKLDDPNIKPQMQQLIALAMASREKMGICSLCANSNDKYMWEKYAGNSSGYCIEYDIDNYEFDKNIFPVIYEDDRQTNIVLTLVNNFIGQLIVSFSSGQIQADASHYLRLFTTKYTKWEYQDEWRILGNAGDKPEAPKISKIVIGKNAPKDKKEELIQLCNELNIFVEEQK